MTPDEFAALASAAEGMAATMNAVMDVVTTVRDRAARAGIGSEVSDMMCFNAFNMLLGINHTVGVMHLVGEHEEEDE